jgi:amino acid transporter
VSEIESSTPASTSTRGPVGETRSVGLSILWFILTIGIYGIYWVYKTQEEVKRYSGNGVGGVLGIVIYILISPVTFFIVPSEVRYMYEDLDGGQSPVRGVTGLWFLLPIVGSIIWFVKVQGALNRYWESKGASPA